MFTCVNIFEVKMTSIAVLGMGLSFASASLTPVVVDILGLQFVLPSFCMMGFFASLAYLTIVPMTGECNHSNEN